MEELWRNGNLLDLDKYREFRVKEGTWPLPFDVRHQYFVRWKAAGGATELDVVRDAWRFV